MPPDDYLDKLKKAYLKTQPSEQMVKFGWDELEMLLADKKSEPVSFAGHFFPRFLTLATVIVVVVFGAFFGLIQVAQAALPGEPLYPVKRLSENIISTFSPGSHVVVEHRAKEILNLSKDQKKPELLEKTVEEYQKAVSESREKITPSSRHEEEFRKKLEEQEEQFEEAQKSGSSSDENLEEAIEAAREGRDGHGDGDDEKEEIEKSGPTGGEEWEENEGQDRSGPNSGPGGED